MLNVDYVVSGSLRRQGKRLTVTVELAETRTARIVWAEVFNHKLDDAFLVLDEIGNRIVASIAQRDRDHRAQPRHPAAAELAGRVGGASPRPVAHVPVQPHRQRAGAAFLRDRGAARSHLRARLCRTCRSRISRTPSRAGRSARAEIDRAFATAGQSLMVDDRDPAAHWAMGRALWLRGDQDQSIVELEQAIDLSPNFALGHYTLAFVQSQAGDAARRHQVLRPLAATEPVRSAAVRHARRPRDGAGAPRAGSTKPPTGPSRRPPARTRTRISWRSPPTAWRWPAGWTRRAAISPQFTRRYRTTASMISSPRCSFRRRMGRCSARPPSASDRRREARYSARRVDHRTHPRIEMPGVILPVHWVKCASARAFLNSAFRASEMPWFGPTSK